MNAEIRIDRTAESDEVFLELVKHLDAELAVRDGEEHGFYAQFNKPVGLGGVAVAYLNGRAVGCGAFKRYDDGIAEIKRMYTRPEARGKRIAAAVLRELEAWAADRALENTSSRPASSSPRRSHFTNAKAIK